VSIRTKIILMAITILCFALGANTFMGSYVFTREYADALKSRGFVIAQNLQFQLDRLLRLGIPINNLKGFEEQCEDIVKKYESISYAVVIDFSGQVLFHNQYYPVEIATNNVLLEGIKQKENNIKISSIDNKRYYNAIVPVFNIYNEHIAAIIIGFPENIIVQKTNTLLAYSAVTVLIFLSIAIVIFVFSLSVWVTNPLRTLVNLIDTIRSTSGNTKHRIQIKSPDEIGKLGSTFNDMLDSLEAYDSQLKQYTVALEEKIAVRTADLQRSNTELQWEIEERKCAEEALRHAKEAAETATRAKSEFLANMSHELRTPLHGILSFAGFGLKRAATAPAAKLRDYFQQIDQSGRVLLLLLNDLLDLAKWEAHPMPCEFQCVDLCRLLATVVDEFRSLTAEKQLMIHFSPPDSPVEILLDPAKMMQVLRNLLSNAVKFSPEGGRIELSLHCDASSVVVRVHDRGVGIPEDELVTIFDQFVQSSRTKTGAGGTGLGLAICREIVTAHHGRIWAEHRSGGGASLFFALPLHAPDETAAATADGEARGTRLPDAHASQDSAQVRPCVSV
jgi:signal transduction histidine kinase